MFFLSRDTYVERVPGETANDRNDRAIRVATQWYDKHLSTKSDGTKHKNPIRVVLLTDDKKNREKADADNILCCSVGDYVKALDKHPTLQDKLSHKDYTGSVDREAIFPPHLTVTEIHEGVKNGKLLQGSFMASRENYLEGSVNVEGYEKFVSSHHIYRRRRNFHAEIDLIYCDFSCRFSYKDTRDSIVRSMVILLPSNCCRKANGMRQAKLYYKTTMKTRAMC